MGLAAAILAAGSSQRLGQPKQLVTLHGHSLVERAIHNAQSLQAEPIFVTLGAHRTAIETTLVTAGLICRAAPARLSIPGALAARLSDKIQILPISDYTTGIAASIRAAATAARAQQVEHLLILLVDQYRVTPTLLHDLYALAKSHPHTAIACGAHSLRTVPAIFPSTWFDALTQLQGDQGAGALLCQRKDVLTLPLSDTPERILGDLDCPQDLEGLG